MAADITDLLSRVTDSTTGRPVIASLASPGKAEGATSINISSATNWTTTTAVHFAIYQTQTVGGVTIKDPDTQTDWKGTLSGTTISNLTITGGTDRAYVAGDIVELTPTARYAKDLYDWGNGHANQDGSLKSAAVQAALNLSSAVPSDYTTLGQVPTTVTANGNRSYSLTFPGVDYTDRLSPGMRLRTVRTVDAPTQCATFDGTNDYFSKSSPSGMTFTDDFVVSAWVKLSSYTAGDIASRFNNTSGWRLFVSASGQPTLIGFNAGSSNYSQVQSYQSIPLNKWVHITAQLDMSSFTATSTTSYIMLDGTDVPAAVTRGGTNPTALVQAGNLEVGGYNGGTSPITGKIAQVAIFSAKITQDTIRDYTSQGLAGTETSLISAYSFNNSVNDLNTTNANNLTANGGVLAATADSPFGGQADGSISTTVDYAIIQKVSYSSPDTTVVVQVPEGCTIPTTGGVTSISYSQFKAPYQFPSQRGKWQILSVQKAQMDTGSVAAGGFGALSWQLNIPIGEFELNYQAICQQNPVSGNNSGMNASLSTVMTSFSDEELTSRLGIASATTVAATGAILAKQKTISLAAATTYYFVTKNSLAVSSTNFILAEGASIITAENAYL